MPTDLKATRPGPERSDDRESRGAGPVVFPVPAPWRAEAPPPAVLTPIIGRERELAAGCEHLTQGGDRLLTITGPGGVGKTRLAIALLEKGSAAFEDGAAFVSLSATTDAERVAPAIREALALPDDGRRSPARILQSTLRDRELLLLLDNFEHLIDAAPLAGDLLSACPRLTILVTSRAPLRVRGERVFPLEPLDLPLDSDESAVERLTASAAGRLFLDRATAIDPDLALDESTAEAIAQICRAVDGLPLAIELAAARSNALDPAMMAVELGPRLPLLTGGVRDLPARQRTMRDAIAWSYDLLHPDDQALFRRLAVFQGGCTIEGAWAVGGRDGAGERGSDEPLPRSVFDQMVALVDSSLVRRTRPPGGETRYEMLETIREFGLERLAAEDDEAAARQRHAVYFLALAEAERSEPRSAGERAWLDRLAEEHDNLCAALEWLARSERWIECLRLATALRVYWAFRSHLNEGRGWLERALAALPGEAAPPALRAQALHILGSIAEWQGDFDRAEAAIEAALATWRALGNVERQAHALTYLGSAALYRGDQALAQKRYEAALAGFRSSGDVAGICFALDNLSDLAYQQHDLARAMAFADEAVAVGRTPGAARQLVAALIGLSQAASAVGDHRRAVEACRESLRVSQEIGYQFGAAEVLVGLANVAAATGAAVQAARLLGAVDTLMVREAVPRLGHEVLHRQVLAATRGGLDVATFDAAFNEGRLLASDEAEAEALAISGEAAPAKSPALTPRQQQVFALMAEGLSDRAIGEALFISTRTVESHVARLCAKLGVRGRTAAVEAAAGLVGSEATIEFPAAPTDSPEP